VSGRLLLVRHGQTASNVAHRLDSRPPGAPLTELGQSQAAALAASLAGLDVVAVVSSVAVRAQQTAAPVAAAHRLGVQVRQGLQETDAGALEDRSDPQAHVEFAQVYGAWHSGQLDEALPDGDSGRDVLERFVPVLQALRATHLGTGVGTGDTARSVVVISHGAAIRLVGAVLGGVDCRFAMANALDNTEAVVLEPTDDGWRCARWGRFSPPFTPPEHPVVDDGT